MKKSILLMFMLCSTLLMSAQNDWANFKRYEEANKSIVNSPYAVFMGNSITDAWYPNHPGFFDSNNLVARGIGGQVTSQMLVRFRKDVIDLKPKAVVILAGTNDIAQNNGYISLENIMGNLISMSELAKAHKIKVFLCSVLPVYEYPWKKEIKEPAKQIKDLNAMIKEYCKKNKCTYVDYYSAMVDERGGLPEKYSTDGVHPKDAGYRVMEEIILKNVLKKK